MSGSFLMIPIDPKKKAVFAASAKKSGLTISALVRILVDDFVEGNITIGVRSGQNYPLSHSVSSEKNLDLEDIKKNVEENFQKMLRV